MIPGINPKQMEKAMKKMGIKQVEIEANEVIINTNEKQIIIQNPQVSKVNMMGQETYQVVGQAEERPLSTEPEISEDDVQTVVDQTGASKQDAVKAIAEANGDLAQAILNLKK